MDSPILRHQRRFNRDTRDAWNSYAAHRDHTTERVLMALPAAAARLCVLGAGNCNDLDLSRLSERCAEIHLVDLDSEAIEHAADRQRVQGLTLHGGVDLTGVATQLEGWRIRPTGDVSDAEAESAIVAARTAQIADVGAEFDVVVSTCVLSQFVDAVANTLGRGHPRSRNLALAIRDRHVRLVAGLVRRGGSGLLVTDALSSSVDPDLAGVPESELRDYLTRCASENRCFVGTNPAALLALCRDDSILSAQLADAGIGLPWRWTLGSITFLVFALSMRTLR